MLTRGAPLLRGWRPVLVLVLLAGVLGMHSLASMEMSEMAMPTASAATSPPASSGHGDLLGAHHEVGPAGATQGAAGGVGAPDHSVMHQCLAVLSTVLLLVLLVLAIATPAPARAAVVGGSRRWQSGRAPPWTVPSLAELSVLRV